MRYGLNLPNGAVDARTLVEFGALAEEAGWDGVFFEDYIVYQNRQDVPTHDPWSAEVSGVMIGMQSESTFGQLPGRELPGGSSGCRRMSLR